MFHIRSWGLWLILLLLLSACGGGSGGNSTGGPVAPSGLSYPSPVIATAGQVLAGMAPTVSGTVTSYTVTPTLPAGVTLNRSTGVIPGTPTTQQPSAKYTITASNAA